MPRCLLQGCSASTADGTAANPACNSGEDPKSVWWLGDLLAPRPEQCPIIDSQGLGLGAEGDLQARQHLEEHSLEQVQSMVVGEVLKDIETACKLLTIAADPADWSPGNVQKWKKKADPHSRLPQIGKSFQELSGKDLCAMSEEQFCQRSPACGDILHAHLDVWKSAAWMKEKAAPGDVRYCADVGHWLESFHPLQGRGQPRREEEEEEAEEMPPTSMARLVPPHHGISICHQTCP
nr:PREDICTED: LOW QUALITY PROTEIN: SAM pointed domain-containing Ets transcription factor [Opisthocomus hoazin]